MTLPRHLTIMEENMSGERKDTPWYLWPFVALWELLAGIIKLTGRLVAAILGLVLMIVGVILCLTVIGAILGIPLLIFGFLLVIRGFF
jgi:hypothetical protein